MRCILCGCVVLCCVSPQQWSGTLYVPLWSGEAPYGSRAVAQLWPIVVSALWAHTRARVRTREPMQSPEALLACFLNIYHILLCHALLVARKPSPDSKDKDSKVRWTKRSRAHRLLSAYALCGYCA